MNPSVDPWSTLVYSARGSDVRMVMVDGHVLLDDFDLTRIDAAEVVAAAREAATQLSRRSGLS
jgi:5-methylthioadenosine/S-adenosylhomocysteine deaminase